MTNLHFFLAPKKMFGERFASSSTMMKSTTEDDGDSKQLRVFFRLRPMNKMEASRRSKHCIEVHKDHASLRVHSSLEGEHDFSLDQVLDEDAGQQEVYQTAVSHVPQKLLQGVSCSVVAYGQTGTGKTHTMLGCHEHTDNSGRNNDVEGAHAPRHSDGLIQRTVAALFDLLKSEASSSSLFTIRCSFIELYLEKIQDLLQPSNNDARLVDGESRIAGLSELCCLSLSDVLLLLERGNACRTSSATQMNADSSRSNAIFLLHLDQTDRLTGKVKSSTLQMADLAGSEFLQKGSLNTEIGMAESSMIQKSLAALNNMVRTRLDAQRQSSHEKFIRRHEFPVQPSQRCKLTHLLQEAFGGNSCTTLILTASPSSFYANETIHALQFGEACRELVNHPMPSQYWSVDMYRRQISKCQQQQGQCSSLLELLSSELQQTTPKVQQAVQQALSISKGTENMLGSLSAGEITVEKTSAKSTPFTSNPMRDPRSEVEAAMRAKDQAERLVQRLQSDVAILQAQNESLANEKSKSVQELIDAKNEIQVLAQRRLEVEHNLRTSQFRENEATVFLRQFRRFYRRLLNHKAAQGSGRDANKILQGIAEHIPGAPDLSELVDIDKLMVESGLLEDYEVGEDTAATEYFPTSAALVRSSVAAKSAADAAQSLKQTNGQSRSPQGSRTMMSSHAENGKFQNRWKDESATTPKWQCQMELQTPAGRFAMMQQEDLEKQFLSLSQRCVQLQKQLDTEKCNADVNINRNGNPKQLETQVASLGQELEEKVHELQAVAWKMSELHLVNKALSEKLANREIHMAYLEENLSDLQTHNLQLSVERQETEGALRNEKLRLRQQLQDLTAPLWQLGEGSVDAKFLTSRIIVSFTGGDAGTEFFKYERRKSTGGVEPLDIDMTVQTREMEETQPISMPRIGSSAQLVNDDQSRIKTESEFNKSFNSYGQRRASVSDYSPSGRNGVPSATNSPWRATKPPVAPWLNRQSSRNQLGTITNDEGSLRLSTKRDDQNGSRSQFDANASGSSFNDSQQSMHLTSVVLSPRGRNGTVALASSPTKAPKPPMAPWLKQQGFVSRGDLTYNRYEQTIDPATGGWEQATNSLPPKAEEFGNEYALEGTQHGRQGEMNPSLKTATATEIARQQNNEERDVTSDAIHDNVNHESTPSVKMPSPRPSKSSLPPPLTRRPPPAGMYRRWSFNCGNGKKDTPTVPRSLQASTTDHPALTENRKNTSAMFERSPSQASFDQGYNDHGDSNHDRAPNVNSLRPANAAQAELFARIRALGHKRPEDVLEATGAVTFDPKVQDKTGFKVLERRLCADLGSKTSSSDVTNTSFDSDNPRASKPESTHSRAAVTEEANIPFSHVQQGRRPEETNNRYQAAKWPVKQHSFRGGDDATKVDVPNGVARARRASGLARAASFTLRSAEEEKTSRTDSVTSGMNASNASGCHLDDDTSKSGSEALHASTTSNFLLDDDNSKTGSKRGSEHFYSSATSLALKDGSNSGRHSATFQQNSSFRSIKFNDGTPADDSGNDLQSSLHDSVGSNFLLSEGEDDSFAGNNNASDKRKSRDREELSSVGSRLSRDPDAVYAAAVGVEKNKFQQKNEITALDRGMKNTLLSSQDPTNNKAGKLTTFFGRQDPPSTKGQPIALNGGVCSDTVSELRTLESVVGNRPKIVNATEDYWETGSKGSPAKKTEPTEPTTASSPTIPAGFNYPLEDWLAGRRSPEKREKDGLKSKSKSKSAPTLEIEFDADLFEGMSLANFEPSEHGKSRRSSLEKVGESKKKKSSSSKKKSDSPTKKKKKKSKDEDSTKKEKRKKDKKSKEKSKSSDNGSDDASGAFDTENFGGLVDSDHEQNGLTKTNHSFDTTSDLFCVVTPTSASADGKKLKSSRRS